VTDTAGKTVSGATDTAGNAVGGVGNTAKGESNAHSYSMI